MTDFIRRRPLISAITAFLLLVLLLSSFPIVPETRQAVVVRFGKDIGEVDSWREVAQNVVKQLQQ